VRANAFEIEYLSDFWKQYYNWRARQGDLSSDRVSFKNPPSSNLQEIRKQPPRMNHLQTYDGTDPIGSPIRDFFQELETYFEAKGTAVARKHSLLDKLIRDPAKLEYEAAIGRAGAGNIANPPVVGTPAEQLQLAEDRYTNCKNWLIARFHGAEEQEAIRDAISAMVQGLNESPRLFYSRVAVAVGQAGYDIAV
jgi:hypothetical protein